MWMHIYASMLEEDNILYIVKVEHVRQNRVYWWPVFPFGLYFGECMIWKLKPTKKEWVGKIKVKWIETPNLFWITWEVF